MAETGISVALTRWVIRHKLLVIALSLVAVAAAGTGIPRLGITNDYRIFFNPDDPELKAHDRLEATFTKADNIAFVLRWAEGTVFTAERLATVDRLTQAAWQLPYVLRVDSITNFQTSRAEQDDIIVFAMLPDERPLSPAAVDAMRDRVFADPLLVDRLVAPDGRTTIVNATIQLPDPDAADTAAAPEGFSAEFGEIAPAAEPGPSAAAGQKESVLAARDLARRIEADNPGLTVAITGIVPLAYAFQEATYGDLATLFPLMGLFLTLALVLFLRTVAGALIAMTIVGASVGFVMGLAGWAGYVLNPASGVGPVIILTIAIADSIHIIATMLTQMRRGMSRHAAIVESLRINVGPVLLTSVTTAIGFVSLNFADAPPFRDLGNMCAVGAIVALLFSVTLLPALLALVPVKARVGGAMEAGMIGGIVRIVIRRRGAIVGLAVLISVVFALFLPRLQINDRFAELFAQGTQFRDDADFMTDHLPGLYLVEFAVASGEENGIYDPAYLERLEAFTGWLADRPEVVHVASLVPILKRLNRNLHGDDPARYRLPESQEAAAQAVLLYEFSLPFGLDLNNQVDIGKETTRVTATLDNVSSADMQQLKYDAERWLADNAPPDMTARGTGVAIIFSFLTERNVKSMFLGTGIAIVLISGCLILALRDVRMGVISLLPNITPPIFAFGVWAILVGVVGLYASAVTAAALGLIVDFTVHFLSKYKRARAEQGLSAEDGVRYAFQTVGTALWVSALVLVAGFSALMLSDFVVNANLGLMTAMIIVIALITDFFLLPAILLLLDAKGDRHAAAAAA